MKRIILLGTISILAVWAVLFGDLSMAKAALPAPGLSSSATSIKAGDFFTLSWAIPANIPENTVIYYQLYLTDKDGGSKEMIGQTTKETSYKISTDKAYWNSEIRYYIVHARGTSLENNGWSNIVKIRVKPIVPNLSVSAVSAFPDEKYILSWSAIPSAKRYYVYESQDASFDNYTKITEGCYFSCDREKTRSKSEEGVYYYKVKACKYSVFSGYTCSAGYSNMINVSVAKAEGITVIIPSLTASANSINSGDSFTLQWDTPSEKPGQTNYHLCSTDANGQKCENLIKTDKTSQTVSTKPLYWSKQDYYYKVKAIVQGVESGWSRVIKVELNPIAPLLKIKTLQIDPAQFKEKVNVGSGASYTLSWDTLSGADLYQLIIRNTDTNEQLFWGLSVNLTQKSYSYKTFSGKSFCYKLRALKVSNESTPWSKEICVKTEPASFSFIAPKTNPISNQEYTIKWTCSGCPRVEKYVFYEDTDSSFNSVDTETLPCYEYSWGGLSSKKINCEEVERRHKNPGAYFYKVEACDKEGNCFILFPFTNTAMVQAPQLSISPKSIKAGQSYQLSWSNVSGAKWYELGTSQSSGACPDGDCRISVGGITSTKMTPVSFPIIPQTVNFYYMLRVDYGGGEYSIWSAEKKVEVKSNIPSPLIINPSSLSSGKQFTLKWPIVSRADKYKICYSERKGGCQNIGSDTIMGIYPKESFTKSTDGKWYLFPVTKTTFLTKTLYYQIRAIGTNPSTGKEVTSPWGSERSVKIYGVEPGLTPANPFYFLDALGEGIHLLFTTDPEKEAQLAMSYAQEKLAEAEAMSMKNNPKAINKAAGQYEKYLNLGMAKIGEIKDENKKEALVVEASKNIFEQQIGLTELKEQASTDSKESIKQVLGISTKGLEQGLKIIPEKEEEIREVLEEIKLRFEPFKEALGEPEAELEPLVPLDESGKLEIREEEGEEIRIIPGVPATEFEPEVEAEPEPEPEPEAEPEPEPEPEESAGPICGNDICETGENCTNCSADCACQIGKTCIEGECLRVECFSDTNCDDGNTCTTDTCYNSGTTQASCGHINITSCINNDDCCPAGCNTLNDSDCQAVCGNGICETGENYTNCSQDCPAQCNDDIDNDNDGKIDYPDDPGCSGLEDNDEIDEIACYSDTDCSDGDLCNIWFCEYAGTVEAYCYFYITITDCYEDEFGCCPPSCTFLEDADCQ